MCARPRAKPPPRAKPIEWDGKTIAGRADRILAQRLTDPSHLPKLCAAPFKWSTITFDASYRNSVAVGRLASLNLRPSTRPVGPLRRRRNHVATGEAQRARK